MFFSIRPEAPLDPESRFRDLDDLPLSALLLDRAGRLIAANARARWDCGLDPFESGRPLWESFWTPFRAGERAELERAIDRVANDEAHPFCSVGECWLMGIGEGERREILAVRLSRPVLCGMPGDGTDPQDDFREFERIANHELQQPLRGIHTTIQMLLRREQSLDEPVRQTLLGMLDEAERMSRLLYGLASFAEVERSDLAPCAIRRCLDRATHKLSDLLPPAAVHSIDLPLRVMADAKGLTRVFEELLRNAAEHRAPGRRMAVEVRARRSGGIWIVEVEDNGEGLDEQYHDAAFRLFWRFRADPGDSRGLGLAVSRRIVEGWSGRIWMEHGASGGAKLVFTVPRLQAT